MLLKKEENSIFNQDTAYQLVSQNQPTDFCVDFDGLWQWCNYTRKDSAKKKLIRNFEEGVDYRVHQISESAPQGGLTHWHSIELTLDCAKSFAMMAGTDQGKVVRKYFIEAEKQYRLLLSDTVTKAELQSFKQDLLNEIRSQCAPINRLDYSIKDGVARIVEAIKVLTKAQPTANKIYATIPAGYVTYADFKSNNGYAFKRGAWSVVKNNMSPSKIIPKDGLNRIEYFDRQEVINTINSLNTSKVINVQYGKTGNATVATVSVI